MRGLPLPSPGLLSLMRSQVSRIDAAARDYAANPA
jgi:hypothetical protein